MEIFNAIIKDTFIGFEDHGIFCYEISFRGDHWSQGLGYYQLDRVDIIKDILIALKVDSWESLKGCYVRVKRADDDFISEIGHIIDDSWVVIRKEIDNE